MPRCGRSQLRRSDQLQSMDRSLCPPLLQNPACAFPRTRLLSEAPVGKGTPPVPNSTKWACDLRFGAFPWRGIAPSRWHAGLALLQRDSLRSLPPHRPHVSLSAVLPSAFASCGIPPDTPSGWHLLPLQWERTYQVTPFPVAMLRIRRAGFSTGFLWQCRPGSGFGCRRLILCLLAPAPQPLALGHGHDGSIHLRLRCP